MEKKFKSGLCLGKFMPVHNGHIYMIREAIKQCETVYVMVCTRVCEPINGITRLNWVEEIFKDDVGVVVVHCDDENPQYPEDNDNFYEIWNKSVYSRIPTLDAVFASEDYVIPFANSLGVEPVMVDKNRINIPVSATAIRMNPFNNWQYIPDNVKAKFRLKVAVVGPESSGKTTLCTDLSEHYDSVMVEEYGRKHTEGMDIFTELYPDDFKIIADEHRANILEGNILAEKIKSKYIFIDTEAIVTRTFLYMYSDLINWSEPITSAVEYIDEIIDLQNLKTYDGRGSTNIDLYLLTYPDLDWVDDGTRDFSEFKDRIRSFDNIKAKLDVRGYKYHIIKGSDRLNTAITLIDNSENEFREKEWHKMSFDK